MTDAIPLAEGQGRTVIDVFFNASSHHLGDGPAFVQAFLLIVEVVVVSAATAVDKRNAHSLFWIEAEPSDGRATRTRFMGRRANLLQGGNIFRSKNSRSMSGASASLPRFLRLASASRLDRSSASTGHHLDNQPTSGLTFALRVEVVFVTTATTVNEAFANSRLGVEGVADLVSATGTHQGWLSADALLFNELFRGGRDGGGGGRGAS